VCPRAGRRLVDFRLHGVLDIEDVYFAVGTASGEEARLHGVELHTIHIALVDLPGVDEAGVGAARVDDGVWIPKRDHTILQATCEEAVLVGPLGAKTAPRN